MSAAPEGASEVIGAGTVLQALGCVLVVLPLPAVPAVQPPALVPPPRAIAPPARCGALNGGPAEHRWIGYLTIAVGAVNGPWAARKVTGCSG